VHQTLLCDRGGGVLQWPPALLISSHCSRNPLARQFPGGQRHVGQPAGPSQHGAPTDGTWPLDPEKAGPCRSLWSLGAWRQWRVHSCQHTGTAPGHCLGVLCSPPGVACGAGHLREQCCGRGRHRPLRLPCPGLMACSPVAAVAHVVVFGWREGVPGCRVLSVDGGRMTVRS
jgi:hypothetical protein